uniref:SET domain-containing protein n=1 Tax=Chromera velia CCMP2878 TaxID=1169474 RepID=A0A0G4G876_9ALVE|mmetsp:Transcript_12121/g.23416  ORF Transcript_12121/g.23416 Transcript_12121/m.23416 type:complete len:238 (+) Transcript_12121:214-927(+)|eukprot:Cvel_20704.t1-p1 / transcript=Cvel_20704.t1 / gene=Cvel_20704 / organism=Chromera_velia_CCMP2878 / gene_product=hypothetical protein / transcript_product=hypothetical protein / location=Cvel_scaffold1884:30275-34642(+) / protein_length=237 / sequence_SO=supercontig / SO=protein_coding / is_pseudo=false
MKAPSGVSRFPSLPARACFLVGFGFLLASLAFTRFPLYPQCPGGSSRRTNAVVGGPTGQASQGVYFGESTIKGLKQGVFAARDFKKGDLVESCTYLMEKVKYVHKKMFLYDYYFEGNYIWEDTKGIRSDGKGPDLALFPLGLCMLYNHQNEPNVDYEVKVLPDVFEIIALRDIQAGEELFIDYGGEYWSYREESHGTPVSIDASLPRSSETAEAPPRTSTRETPADVQIKIKKKGLR